MNDTDTQTTTIPAELVTGEETALAPHQGVVGLAPIAGQANALEIIERQAAIQQAVNLALLKQTEPEDWTASKMGEQIYCNPGGSATRKIARFLAIEIRGPSGEARPTKEAVLRGDVKGYRMLFQCRSLVLGSLSGLPPHLVPWLPAETHRWEDEDFTGRQVNDEGKIVKRDGTRALESDLSAAADSAVMNRAVGQLTGLRKVPLSMLERAFGSTKVLDRIPKGFGFGTGGQRNAQRVAEDGVTEKAKALWDEILRRASGDESMALEVLREITSYPAAPDGKYKAFGGVKSWQEITRENSVKFAWKKLKEHSALGDRREREPGED